MLDGRLRGVIDPPLNEVGRGLHAIGITANAVTLLGLALGFAAFPFLLAGAYGWALLFVGLNRLADGLDGAVARAAGGGSDFGGYLDILADFVFYGGFVLFYGLGRPDEMGWALLLLASFYASGASFLGFAIIAAKRGIETRSQGHKAIYYAAGLAEGAETILAFVLLCLFPGWMGWIAGGFAALCLITGLARSWLAARLFTG